MMNKQRTLSLLIFLIALVITLVMTNGADNTNSPALTQGSSLSTSNLQQHAENKPLLSFIDVTGLITYDRVGFIKDDENDPDHYLFSPSSAIPQPSRFIVVKLLDQRANIIASTTTDNVGRYHFQLPQAQINTSVQLELMAQLELDAQIDNGFSIEVKDQATSTALDKQLVYFYRSQLFELKKGVNYQDIALGTGWDDKSKIFIPEKSHAQPFAILDTVYKGAAFLMAAGISFHNKLQPLTINWTQQPGNNEKRNARNAFYSRYDNRILLKANFTDNATIKQGLGLTEWDEHTIIHEFGHYYQQKLIGRNDTQGGAHSLFSFSTLPLAFSEGLASALAYTVLKDWQHKHISKNITAKNKFKDLQAISRNEGERYTQTRYFFSSNEETTNAYFIGSLIDPNMEYNARTSNLANEIGIAGLHHAMLNAAQQPALMTVYSVAEQLKLLFPQYTSAINNLGDKLNITLNDQWGTGQIPLEPEMIYAKQLPLPIDTYLPFYKKITIGGLVDLSFNGGFDSPSNDRPGTSRYVRFNAQQDDILQIRVLDAYDSMGNIHSYRFELLYQGQVLAQSKHKTNEQFSQIKIKIPVNQEYILKVYGERYVNDAFHVNDTVSTTVYIDAID